MFDYRVDQSHRVSIVWVEFENSSSGCQCRQKMFNIQHYRIYNVVRRQFPLQMSAAKTIHKAQGSTMNFGSRKNDHIHDAGLSRIKNLSNLFIKE